MSLRFTAAHSSRITKKSSSPFSRRSSASPLASSTRKSSVSRSPSKQSTPRTEVDDPFEPLEDHGLVKNLADDLRFRDVAQHIQHVRDNMFDAIPEHSGMNSTRTAEVLNFQRNLPPLVTVAHILSMSNSPTTTEREIAELVQHGIIRRVTVPLRGVGSDAIGECLVLMEHWEGLVRNHDSLTAELKEKYIQALRDNPAATTISTGTFYPPETQALVQAGFLTAAASVLSNVASVISPASSSFGSLPYLSSAGSRGAAGSAAAVGGQSAVYDAGGGGSGMSTTIGASYAFCLPNLGPYLKLLAAARQYLIALLAKTKYKELPLDLLKERWDVTSAGGDKRTTGKGLEGAILPVRTKKWKQFYGLKFSWVVQECAGSGAIELFNTGSVGIGARLTS